MLAARAGVVCGPSAGGAMFNKSFSDLLEIGVHEASESVGLADAQGWRPTKWFGKLYL